MKPRTGIYGLTSCAGDQLALLNCEDELLAIVGALDLRSFVMAQSNPAEGELDVAFVEGAVAQPRDLATLKEIRERSALLVALGTCAVWGGFSGEPLSAHVQVDLAIPGCPVEKEQLLSSLASLLHGDVPLTSELPVCAECKMHEYSCLLVNGGQACLGPVTLGGCQARCPGRNLPCAGCRGPVAESNLPAAFEVLAAHGHDPEAVRRRLATFAPAARGGKA